MLIPLVGFADSGSPLMSARISGTADGSPDCPSPFEVARRLGIAATLALLVPPTVLASPPGEEQAALLRDVECIVGPFSFDRADEAREWLSAGARYALFTAPAGGDVAAAVAGAIFTTPGLMPR